MNAMARMAGILFLVATGAFMAGNGILDSVLQRPDFLSGLFPDRSRVVAGAVLEFVNAMAVIGIAMLLFPILRKHNEAFALGYFGSRMIESVLLIISLICPIVLIGLSEDYLASGASDRVYFQALGNSAVEIRLIFFNIAMIVLGVGSLLLCFVLYRSKLIPRWLSVIGFIGYAALLASSCLSIAGEDVGSVLFIPGAIFEILFPLWLIIKGVEPGKRATQ
ncbi:DUF4386 domain-containing protein [Cohnella soli]|uniref:DUF4386 domain-containing protein n=1 Tax=Cohnella soli TaxID=425005 RepID=A0ABW0I2V9_9BACL